MNKVLLSLVSVGVIALGACGGDHDPVAVDQPWARATSAVQPHGAVYFELTVDHDDVLTGASVPASIAGGAEIHEVVEAAHDASGHGAHDASDGVAAEHGDMAPGMIMREVAGGLHLTADEMVPLAPGGYHVMLIDLADSLEVGDRFELTLTFAENDDVTITVPVEETAP